MYRRSNITISDLHYSIIVRVYSTRFQNPTNITNITNIQNYRANNLPFLLKHLMAVRSLQTPLNNQIILNITIQITFFYILSFFVYNITSVSI